MAKAGGFIGFTANPGRSLFSLLLLIVASKLRGFRSVPAESASAVRDRPRRALSSVLLQKARNKVIRIEAQAM